MAGESVILFLSCVSDEFGVYRDALRHALTRPNVDVKIQEDFKALGGDTLEMLEDYIERCEAVVHFLECRGPAWEAARSRGETGDEGRGARGSSDAFLHPMGSVAHRSVSAKTS